MTRMTNRALARKFDGSVRREEAIESTLKVLADCRICDKPIYVSPGQLIKSDYSGGFSHKACRQ